MFKNDGTSDQEPLSYRSVNSQTREVAGPPKFFLRAGRVGEAFSSLAIKNLDGRRLTWSVETP